MVSHPLRALISAGSHCQTECSRHLAKTPVVTPIRSSRHHRTHSPLFTTANRTMPDGCPVFVRQNAMSHYDPPFSVQGGLAPCPDSLLHPRGEYAEPDVGTGINRLVLTRVGNTLRSGTATGVEMVHPRSRMEHNSTLPRSKTQLYVVDFIAPPDSRNVH